LRRRTNIASLTDVLADVPLSNDAAAVLFTSGATGPAKGVRYTHGQLCAQRDALQTTYGITSSDRFVAAFAPFALYGPALGICTGLADMDVTSPSTLTAKALNDACRRIDATMVFASPAALHNVVETATGNMTALSKVRLIMSAGAPVPITTLENIASLAPHAHIHTPYGMTEALPVSDISLVERRAIGNGSGVCVGHSVSNAHILIASIDQTEPVEKQHIGDTGEVLVRAPWVSSGYDRLWLTEQRARPVVTTDGQEHVWHRTGDVGHVDVDGNLWIEGRVVHLIHGTSGIISPVPLEIAVEALPNVRRAAAVSVGPIGIQQVVIVVEGKGDGPADAELSSAVRAAVAPQLIAAVYTTKQLPVDIRHNSKIDRTALGLTMARILSGEPQ
jgi:acyl-coenzyme A synthetase/AMP-(fatty) acid ligase